MKKYLIPAFILLISISVSSQVLDIKPQSMAESSKENKYNITANYPLIDFGPNALMGVRGIANDINTAISDVITGLINPFKEQVIADTSTCPQPDNTMEINYRTLYRENDYLSFMFETFSDPRCAAHPMTFRTSFNYSYTSKGLLTIDSLFAPGSGWLEYISENCIKELKAQAKKDQMDNIDDMITSGASAKPVNFNTFTINNQSLEITFNLYQVGPYVWGFRTVSIPWKALYKMIDPSGPVAFLVGK